MHYRNGREAKAGDKVIHFPSGGYAAVAGILHSVVAGSTTCNGRLAVTTQNDPYVTIGECLHQDDMAAAGQTIGDSSKPAPVEVAPLAGTAAAIAILVCGLCALLFGSGCSMFGKNAVQPMGIEKSLFTVRTNVIDQVVTTTNTVTVVQTNVVPVVQQVTVTNQIGVPVMVPVTNYHTVTITNVVQQVATTTNELAVPRMEMGPGANTVMTVAGVGSGLFGWGGLVTTVLGGVFSMYLGLRNKALAGQATVLNQTAGALTQNIETLMNVLQSTPQGQQAMPFVKNYLMSHQTEAGVIQSVAGLIENFVNEPAAKQSAAEIVSAIQTIQSAQTVTAVTAGAPATQTVNGGVVKA